MSSIPDQFPISLRAWPQKPDRSGALTSLISRINIERGGFRNITEESLAEEIEKEEAEGHDTPQSSSDSESDSEEPDRFKELMTAREQMLGNLEQAHHTSMLALDFISLLLSQTTPVQASLTISPALREATGVGTLGADKIADPRTTFAQKQDTENIVKGWKLQSLNENADSILKSAEKLEKEIEAETKYWQQLVEIDAQGWAVCPLPQEQHTLGVRFGFFESAPAFTNRSVAALRRQPNGSIVLDQGISEKPAQRLRVRVQTNGETSGEWTGAAAVNDDSPILPLIKRARNAIFTDELWQELNRETRVLASSGVRSTGSTITCPLTSSKQVVLDLLPASNSDIHDSFVSQQPSTNTDENIAHALWLSLYLLLSNAHREKLNRRSQHPAPMTANKAPQASTPPLSLLRPVLGRITYQSSVNSLTAFLTQLSAALLRSSLTLSELTVENAAQLSASQHASKSSFVKNKAKTSSSASTTIAKLFAELHSSFSLPLPITSVRASSSPTENKDTSLQIKTRTLLQPIIEPRFRILAPPELSLLAPVPQTASGFGGDGGLREVISYVSWAVACSTCDYIVSGFGGRVKDGKEGDDSKATWEKTYDPTIIRSVGGGGRVEIGIEVVNSEATGTKVVLKSRDKRQPGGAGKMVFWTGAAVDGDEDQRQGGETRSLKEVVDELAPDANGEGLGTDLAFGMGVGGEIKDGDMN